MKESPLLLRPELSARVLVDQKTQTRRLVKGTALEWLAPDMFLPEWVADPDNSLSPYGYPGDLLYVRESHWQYGTWEFYYPFPGGQRRRFVRYFDEDIPDRPLGFRWTRAKPLVQYSLTPPDAGGPDWFRRPSIFLPKFASRIWLKVTALRIERLQEITNVDARAEGMAAGYLGTYRDSFAITWNKINGKRGPWDSNPWVWVVDFERTEKPDAEQ